jgi:hypothetical protein
MRASALFVLIFMVTLPALGQRSTIAANHPGSCSATLKTLKEGGTPAAATKLPLSYFGVGIGADAKGGGSDRIADAAVVGGNITTLDDDNVTMGPVLEAHAFVFTLTHDWAVRDDEGNLFVTKEKPCDAPDEFPTIATGPFTMLRLGDNEIIKSLGVGWMVGFRLRQSDNSLNVGIAYTFQQDVKTYAAGFEEGKPLPTGEKEIRYRNKDGRGLAVVISFGW